MRGAGGVLRALQRCVTARAGGRDGGGGRGRGRAVSVLVPVFVLVLVLVLVLVGADRRARTAWGVGVWSAG